MRKLVIKGILFTMLFCSIFLFLDEKFYNWASCWEATDDWEEQNFDIVFIGNSHVHTNIIPVIINDALNINTVDLSTDGQSSEITYYIFKNLLEKTIPRSVAVEINVLSSSIEAILNENKQGRIYQAFDGIRSPFKRAEAIIDIVPADNWISAFSQLTRPTNIWTRFKYWNSTYRPYHILGFNPIETMIEKNSIDAKSVESKYIEQIDRRPDDLTINLEWLQKILDLAERKNIPVYLIKSPVGAYSAFYADMAYDVKELSKKYSIVKGVINFNEHLSEIGLESEDYRDTGHLNRLGAVKFTEYLTHYFGKEFDITPDFSNVGWYKSENYRQLSDNEWRYTVDLYDGALIKFSLADTQGNILESTDYSEKNYIDIPRIGNSRKLTYTIKGINEHSYTHNHEQIFTFMSDRGSLAGFTEKSLIVTQEGNTVTVTNNFNEVPGTFAWYVIKDGAAILKLPYDSANTFSYTFTEPGNYYINAYFMMSQDRNERKSVKTAELVVDKNGILFLK